MRRCAWLLILLGIAMLGSPIVQAASSPEIVSVVANPIAHGDRGEYVVLSVPEDTDLGAFSIDDGEGVARFPDRTVSGRIAASTEPDALNLDMPVVALAGELRLSNSGETLRLQRTNETIQVVSYASAPEGEAYDRRGETWVWRPIGATDRPIITAQNVTLRSFVLPDTPAIPIERVRGASDRILLAGYTFTSARLVDALCRATERGVTVRVLLEGQPVGGLTTRAATRLDGLTACGVDVALLGGEPARYAFHHAKYAVVDDAALVLTENWKPSGTGGRSNRGWGGFIRDRAIADGLAETFRADASFRDAVSWRRFRNQTTPVEAEPTPTGEYPARFESDTTTADSVSVLAVPDNAASAIEAELDAAETRIRIQQLSIGSRGHPFVKAILRAADRGVSVKVLLGSASYVRRDNQRIVDWLNKRARNQSLPLEAKLAQPRSRFSKIHAKGIIVDQTVILGSINWTNESIRNNREIAILIRDPAVAQYYHRVFRADWRGGQWTVTVGLILASGLGIGVAAIRAIRLEFDPDYSVSPDAVIEP